MKSLDHIGKAKLHDRLLIAKQAWGFARSEVAALEACLKVDDGYGPFQAQIADAIDRAQQNAALTGSLVREMELGLR